MIRPFQIACRIEKSHLFPIILLCMAGALTFSVWGEDATVRRQLDDLDAWLDGYMQAQLDAYWIAGAAVAIVTDERIITRGYGFQDPISQTPVDPNTTMFRIASITKTFTWAAVMELVQEEVLSLDVDISRWVEDEVFPKNDRPEITIRHLVNHLAGFEEIGGRLPDWAIEETPTNRAFVSTYRPQILYPPGEVYAYSNYGAALAGAVIESATGIAWEDWVQDHLLVPGGMSSSVTTRQDSALLSTGRLSAGWSVENGRWVEHEQIGFGGAAAGGISATANGMGRWLWVFLHQGMSGEGQVLAAETVASMLSPREGYHPGLRNTYLGFSSAELYDQRIVGHGGSFSSHVSQLLIFPDLDVGVFVSYNSFAPSAVGDFVDAITRYLIEYPRPALGRRPRAETQSMPVADDVRGSTNSGPSGGTFYRRDLDGYYADTRSSFSTIAKINHLNDAARVITLPDGSLEVDWMNGAHQKLVPLGENLWKVEGEESRVAVHHTLMGSPLVMVEDPTTTWGMRKLSLLEYPPLHVAGFWMAVIVFGFTFVWIPLAPMAGCYCPQREIRRARRPVRIVMWVSALWGTMGSLAAVWAAIVGAEYVRGNTASGRVIAASNLLFFVVWFMLALVTLGMWRLHRLGRRSIPTMTIPLMVFGLFYICLSLWWNLVPWKLA
jgi:CubicO group peptidase (beta-lactamase class C family)